MGYIVLLGTASILSACVQTNIEEEMRPEAGPSVSFPYTNVREYNDAAVKADSYCAQQYNARARPAGEYSESGGEAMFLCVS